jgi:hypothetical protein
MLTRQFLHIAQNFGAPTRITTLAFPKFHILLFPCFPAVLRLSETRASHSRPRRDAARLPGAQQERQ